MRDGELAVCFLLTHFQIQENQLHHQMLHLYTHMCIHTYIYTHTYTHIYTHVYIRTHFRMPDVVQICFISITNLSSELFSPSHHSIMKYLYFNNISETLQMRRKKKPTYLRSSARYLSSDFILWGILGLSLDSSLAETATTAFERTRTWLLGGTVSGFWLE